MATVTQNPAIFEPQAACSEVSSAYDRDSGLVMSAHILISVKYEADATDGQRALAWLVPELARAGLTLTERDDVRTWDGVIDGDDYARLADAWDLDEHTATHRYAFDGMEWKSGGSSPVVWVTLDVTELDPLEGHLARAAA